MSSEYAVFGQSAQDFCRRLERLTLHPEVIEGDRIQWRKLGFSTQGVNIVLTKLEYTTPGDNFSQCLSALLNQASAAPCADANAKEQILSQLRGCKVAVGVTANPWNEGIVFDVVSQIALIVEGVIFNGTALLSNDEDILLAI